MKIEWNIEKKRGFYRPKLNIQVVFEDWEKALYIPTIYVKSTIPRPAYDTEIVQRTCEIDDDRTDQCYTREINSSDTRQSYRLPFRHSGEYPEVAESMAILRDEIERRIIQAHDALALDITGSLEMTPATKKHVAAYAAAWKMTQQKTEY